jgi:hypothetical protein
MALTRDFRETVALADAQDRGERGAVNAKLVNGGAVMFCAGQSSTKVEPAGG